MPSRTRVTDDEVLDWWEAYDRGLSVKQIAALTGRNHKTIRDRLTDLDVYLPDRDRGRQAGDPIAVGLSAQELAPYVLAQANETDHAIMDALARLVPTDDAIQRNWLPFAHALPHAIRPGRHTTIVQSSRQRANEKTGAEVRKIVRQELAASGLLPPGAARPMGQRRFH